MGDVPLNHVDWFVLGLCIYIYTYNHIYIYTYMMCVYIYIYTHMYMWVSCRVHLDPVACKIMLEMVDDSLSSHQVT